jgi:lipoprotein-releasing system permease protein
MYKLLLCLRYLRTRYIALASIVSVMLGVATMIVVNSVMAGFGTEMRQRIHGILADVIIETKNLDGAPDAELHMAVARQAAGEFISGMTATVEVYGMLSFQYAGEWMTRPVTLIGIHPESKAKVGPLIDSLDSYNPVYEDGFEIRPALRSHDEPPGWELTAEAKEYRKELIERQRWWKKHFHAREVDQDRHAAGRPTEEFGPAPLGATANHGGRGNYDGLVGEYDPESADSDIRQAAAADSDELSGDPFGSQDPSDLFNEFNSAAANDDEADDPYALMDGRVYVGVGLVTFQYEDRDTGRIKTEMLVRPGDNVKLSTVTAGRPPNPVHFNATVVDVFKSGMSEYDSNLVFCNLEYLQEIRQMVDPETQTRSITAIQIKLKDFAHADEVVERLKQAFPPGTYMVQTWERKQGPLLAAVEVEAAILNVLLFLIITVAGFGILAIFYMIVVEKTRDIGILKALGASSRGVMTIFLSYGLALGIVGSGVGVILGLLFVRYINVIESWITWISGRKVFDERIYYFPEIPTHVEPAMVFWVAFGAMAIAVLASILPARRAARLHPVEALRFE